MAAFGVSGACSQINYNNAGWGVDPMAYSRVGTAGWQFLKLPSNARSMAMGGVRAALAHGDADAAFMNPASTSDVKDFDLAFSTMEWVADIQYSGISAVKNLQQWGTIGVNLAYVNYGDMVRTEIGEFNGSPGAVAITEGLGTFTAHDLAFGLLYSRQITDRLQLGGNIRFLEEQLDDARMRSWGVDVGTLYYTGLGSLRISMLGRNFGPDGEFQEYEGRIAQSAAKVRMPMMFVLGAAMDLLDDSPQSMHRITLAAEYVKPNDGPEKVNVGAEYFMFQHFYFRGGYRFNYDEERYTFGIGGEFYGTDEMRLKADIAYADLGRFGYVTMLTFGVGL
jgi:hypothetical protein